MATSLHWQNIAGVERFETAVRALGRNDGILAYRRALARTGDMARTQVRRALVKQTGLKRKIIVKAIKVIRPTFNSMTYTMRASGGDIGLHYFDARETRRGVSARPFNKRQVFPGTFQKGGRFPKRVELNMGGQVMQRVGSKRLPLMRITSGVIIPAEMVKGATAEAFESTVSTVLPGRVAHEIGRLTGGVVT